MKRKKYIETIIHLMNEVEKLSAQHLFEESGESYLKLTRQVFKELAQEPLLFQSIIDDLLFDTQYPTIQIEMATEAIGMNYRVREAVELLESYAKWEQDMTYQNARGKLCNTAQMRLFNLLDYDILHDMRDCWTRPEKIEVSAICKQFFEERNGNKEISM